MTFIRRPARANKKIASSPVSEPSKETKIMSESAKAFIEDKFTQMFQETSVRRDKYNAVMNSPNLNQEEKEKILSQYAQEESDFARKSRSKIKTSRFERIKLIGRGGFGEVWLVKDNEDRNFYALKVLRKADIIMSEQIQNVRTERDILAHLSLIHI